MWLMAEEDGRYSIEEIEQGSLVRSGNSKVEVSGNTDTLVCVQYDVIYWLGCAGKMSRRVLQQCIA
jgi:hypothetical protein